MAAVRPIRSVVHNLKLLAEELLVLQYYIVLYFLSTQKIYFTPVTGK
jgi:hypothetical protein